MSESISSLENSWNEAQRAEAIARHDKNKKERNTGNGNPPGGDDLEARVAALEKAIPEIREKLAVISGKVDSIEKHAATKADLATTELNLIKWYVGTAFAMTGLASAITFGLTRLLSQ